MKVLSFRPERLLPVELVFGSGYRNLYVDELAAVGQEVGAMPDDAVAATVRGPCEQAVAHLLAVARRHVMLADAQQANMTTPMTRATLARGQADAANALPTSGWGGPMDLESAKAGERARVERQLLAEAATAAVEKLQPKLEATAADAVEAMQSLQIAIKKANAEWRTPSSLRADLQLVDLQRIRNLEDEIDARGDDAMVWALEQVTSAIEFERVDVLKCLVPAARACAVKVLRTPHQKLARDRQTASHYSEYAETGDDAHALAKKVVQAIQSYEAGQRPASLILAENVAQRLRPIFVALLGLGQGPDLATLYYVDAPDRAHKGPEWQVDPQWPMRFLAPSPNAPFPGWSRIVMRTDGRRPVREPNPAAVDDGDPPPRARAEVKNLRGNEVRDKLVAALRGGGR